MSGWAWFGTAEGTAELLAPAPYLCDWPIDGGKRTCDRPICAGHVKPIFGQKDRHYCPPHQRMSEALGASTEE